MTEWGSLALVDEGQGDVNGKSISLPGVKAGDMSSRLWKPEVRVSCVHFSPTGKKLKHTLYNVISQILQVFTSLFIVCILSLEILVCIIFILFKH